MSPRRTRRGDIPFESRILCRTAYFPTRNPAFKPRKHTFTSAFGVSHALSAEIRRKGRLQMS